MSKTARLYRDTRTAASNSGLDRLNDDLQDVTRIMTKNMEELLWRGDSLDRSSLFLTMDEGWPLLIYRNVASLSLVTYWFRKVPQSREEHQCPSYDSEIRTVGRCCLNYRYSIILEIWMIHAPWSACHILLLAFIFISAMACVKHEL